MARISHINSATPLVYEWGVEDLSVLPTPVTPDNFPIHLPKIYVQTEWGLPGDRIVPASMIPNMYGADSLKYNSKFANHATLFLNTAIANSNAVTVHRVTAGAYARNTLALDIVETDVQVYERDADGKYLLDNSGMRIPVVGSTVPGYIAKFVMVAPTTEVTHSDIESGTPLVGQQTVQAGNMVGSGGATSTLYPIMDVPAMYPGARGNQIGFRLYLDPERDTSISDSLNAILYKFQVVEKSSEFNSTSIVKTNVGGSSIDVSLSEEAVNEFSNAPYFAEYAVDDSYGNEDDSSLDLNVPRLNDIHVYSNNIETILDMVKVREDEYIKSVEQPAEPWTQDDIDTSLETKYLFDIISGVDSSNRPYHTFAIDESVSTNSVRLTKNNNIMLQGGADNILNVADYEAQIRIDAAKYADPDSEYQDHARNLDSVIWDSGFTLETTEALLDYVSYRHDTFIIPCSYVDTDNLDGAPLTIDEEYASALRLRELIHLRPESDYFGTKAFRGMIVGGSCKLVGSSYRKRVTNSIDLFSKFCRYMGSSNGRFRPTQRFNRGSRNVMVGVKDVSIPWIPPSGRISLWSIGLNVPAAYNTRDMYWPALQTVADDNTVLNSPLTALAVAYVNKVVHRAHRDITGVDDLSNGEIEQEVDEFITNDLFGRFDGRVIIEPATYHSKDDLDRGYSFSTPVDVSAGDMKTVMRSWVRVRRLSDS